MFCMLVCQDVELCQAGQGGDGEQIVLVALHVHKLNCDSCDGLMDPVDGPDRICVGRAAWCELLALLSLVESWRAPKMSHTTTTWVMAWNRGL